VTDNSKNRLHEVFFYGLYMDPDILVNKSIQLRNPRIACAENFELKIGNKATLLRSPGKTAHGIVYSLTHEEINSLYWGSGLNEYAAEVIMIKIKDDYSPALTCNLIDPPKNNESNPEYKQKLKEAMKNLGVSTESIE